MPTATAQDPLAELRGLHLPPDPGWWPPAPGWWLLAAAVVLMLVGLALLIRYWRRPTPRKAALRELEHLESLQSQAQFPDLLAAWFRRCAITRDGQAVAGLTGERWQQQLQQAAPDVDITLVYQTLFEQRYRPEPDSEMDTAQLLGLSRRWARQALS